MLLLTIPATSQTNATRNIHRGEHAAPRIAPVLFEYFCHETTAIVPESAANEINHGMTAGDGPEANGLSHGKIKHAKTATS